MANIVDYTKVWEKNQNLQIRRLFCKTFFRFFKTGWNFGNGASFRLAEQTKESAKCQYLEGFRLPNGAFAGTQIERILLFSKKNHKISTDISNILKNPSRILGETREKTNRSDVWKTMFTEV